MVARSVVVVFVVALVVVLEAGSEVTAMDSAGVVLLSADAEAVELFVVVSGTGGNVLRMAVVVSVSVVVAVATGTVVGCVVSVLPLPFAASHSCKKASASSVYLP